MTYKIPKAEILYISPLINFKSTGNTIIFRTTTNERFAITGYTQVCASATAANGDATLNLGWTATAYDDFTSNNGFLPVIANNFDPVTYAESPMIPANTDFRINVTSADTGTDLTGYIVISGFTINT